MLERFFSNTKRMWMPTTLNCYLPTVFPVFSDLLIPKQFIRPNIEYVRKGNKNTDFRIALSRFP